VGQGEQLRRALGRHAAADEDRHVGHGAAHALEVLDRRGLAGGAAGDDEAVGEAAGDGGARLLLGVHGDQRDGVRALHGGGEGGDGAGGHAAGGERRVAVVFHDESVHAVVHERARVADGGGDRAIHGAVPAGTAGQRREVHHADETHDG